MKRSRTAVTPGAVSFGPSVPDHEATCERIAREEIPCDDGECAWEFECLRQRSDGSCLYDDTCIRRQP